VEAHAFTAKPQLYECKNTSFEQIPSINKKVDPVDTAKTPS
jgi:hypothetical protein